MINPKISRVKVAIVQANFYWTYVRVFTKEDGLFGTGEAFFAPGLSSIIEDLGEILIGEDPTRTEYLVEKMRWAASGAGSLGGIIWNAITGIEAALLDLKGKIYGIPVYELLGGRLRDSVPIYVDCHGGDNLEALDVLLQPAIPDWESARAERSAQHVSKSHIEIIADARARARQMVDQGFDILKFDLDLPDSTFDSASGYSLKSSDIDWLTKFAHGLREEVGPDIGLAFDAHWRYRGIEIIKLCRELQAVDPLWIEDPFPPQDTNGFASLTELGIVPVATGENLQLRHGFVPYIEKKLCDILTPDLQKAGGLLEAKYITGMAVNKNLGLGIHMIGSPVALAASIHLATTLPNLIACEFHATDVPFFHELVRGGTSDWLIPGSGRALHEPGFGIELNEKVARKYLLDGAKYFE